MIVIVTVINDEAMVLMRSATNLDQAGVDAIVEALDSAAHDADAQVSSTLLEDD